MAYKYHVLLGGLGDDAHSAGIYLLEYGLREAGYLVDNIGIQNMAEDFLEKANDYQIVLMSNKNGHSHLFLKDFGYLYSSYKNSIHSKQLWYLGGHLAVSEKDEAVIKYYLGMGFDRVFPRTITLDTVLKHLERDINEINIEPKEVRNKHINRTNFLDPDIDNVSDAKWEIEELDNFRTSVLNSWETGKSIKWDKINSLHRKKSRNLDYILNSNVENYKNPLIQPRTGVADISKQISKLQDLEEAGIDVASIQLDASSRVNNYPKAREGVEISLEKKNSYLNGFPVPIYGQDGIEKIVTSLNIPFQIRGGAPDHRLTYEIAISGGASAVEGGFLCYLFPYDKSTAPSKSLQYWQYVDRLVGRYFENNNIRINREWFGTLTANLIEPSLAIVVNIIQSVLSAQQGVKSIAVGYAEQGNRAQDIAAINVLNEMTRYYLKKYGFSDIHVSTVFHQYMAAFPTDTAKAENLIYNSAITAKLSKATRMMMKSPVEAIKIPSTKENILGMNICKKAFSDTSNGYYDHKTIEFEKSLIKEEVNSILNSVFELGNGSLSKGTIKAFHEGIIDIPFSPNNYNAGKVMGLRDINGAIRFAETGNLPFSTKIKEFHHNKVVQRKISEREPQIFKLIEKDLLRIHNNDFDFWPLDKSYLV